MLKKLLIGIFLAIGFVSTAAPAGAVATSPQSFMAAPGCPARLLTLPAWYRGLAGDTDCNPKISKLSDLWVVALNVVEMLMHVAVYTAAGFIMWGGFQYILATNTGSSEKSGGAKSVISNAVVGLIISVMGIAIVNFIVDAAF